MCAYAASPMHQEVRGCYILLATVQTQGAAVDAFLARLDACAAGEVAFSLVLDDPAGNSYVEAGTGPDAALALERYERTPEQARGAALGCRQGVLVCGGQKLCCSYLQRCTTWLKATVGCIAAFGAHAPHNQVQIHCDICAQSNLLKQPACLP